MIRGRVVRADTGEPLRRVQVRVDGWDTGDQSGAAATMTNAEGRYELTQLPAGTYTLNATRGGYVDVAYGQRRPFERGRPLKLGEGEVLQNIDFVMPPGGVVTGRVVDEMGEAVAHASVSLVRRRYVDGRRRLVAQNGSSTDDRGEFRIFGVAPGDYLMIATLHMMDFGSRDRERYVPRTDMGSEPPAVRDDWSFEVRGLRGGGFMRAGRLGDWQMKRVRREGADLTDAPLDFAADIDDLEIELADRVTTVSGGVSDDRGRDALDSTVMVFADDPGKWGRHSRFIQSARPDQQGRFTIRGLPRASTWRLPSITWSPANNAIRKCSPDGVRVQPFSPCLKAKRTRSF